MPNRPARPPRLLVHLGLLMLATPLVGCQTGSLGRMFASAENTTFQTPKMRIDEAHAIAARGRKAEAAAQQELVNDLTRRIQDENDPLVREAIAQSLATFPQPLAGQVLTAGLGDSDQGVRVRCCQLLGLRGEEAAVATLSRIAAQDEDVDVRIAATRALGKIKSPAAVRALAVALEDNNPAMQFAGVQAMQSATGQDLGGDVKAYIALARGDAPQVAAKPESNESASPY